jgi:hypothetical protein
MLPLWSPSAVALGDVGYLDTPAGAFRTLFNAFDPVGSSAGRMGAAPSLYGYGRVGRGSQRVDKRNAAQRGFDAVQNWLTFRRGSLSKCVRPAAAAPARGADGAAQRRPAVHVPAPRGPQGRVPVRGDDGVQLRRQPRDAQALVQSSHRRRPARVCERAYATPAAQGGHHAR